MHFYSIILAMAFVNALNEAAREADVFRIFARGQGYLATFKCQQAFRVGAGFCMLASRRVPRVRRMGPRRVDRVSSDLHLV